MLDKLEGSWMNIVLALSLVVIAFRILSPVGVYEVSGNSMNPAYVDGDVLIGDKGAVPGRYDVVIAASAASGIIVKRVVGLPGETVEISEDGLVYVDGEHLGSLSFYQEEKMESEENAVWNLQEDEYFLLGDNVNYSEDSRAFGPFAFERIVAVVRQNGG